ncbi:MAG: GTPase HflX [Victivallaceae bacterium]|nr:GTPase HflX [Victivallaceae bacterium]
MIDNERENSKKLERAYLIGFRSQLESETTVEEHLDELSELVRSLELDVCGRSTATVRLPSPALYIGSGKADQIIAAAKEAQASCLVFDSPLSPSQQRNWEHRSKLTVIDREEIILDIFGERASTREAVLQVEVARLQYYLPRLTRAWSHLSRQHGGVTGARGQGETQIETDRRIVKRELTVLRKELAEVRSRRSVQRRERERSGIVCGAIVGYTNVGKSSLLNALAESKEVYVADKLFATLDPTTRRITLGGQQELLLTDTVGFVRKLPHSLVEAFKSTLEEAIESDFLMLVINLAEPNFEQQWETTLSVLRELGAEEKNILMVFNQIDRVPPDELPMRMIRARSLFPDAVYVSAKTAEGLDALRLKLALYAGRNRQVIEIKLPPARADLAAFAHARTTVLEESCDEEGNFKMRLSADEAIVHKFNPFLCK